MTRLQLLRRYLCASAMLLAVAPTLFPAASGNAYLVHNLVADQPGIADFTDPNLLNPWGLYTSGGSPFWVNNGANGLATVYSSNGAVSTLKVAVVPGAKSASPSVATGGVANATGGFQIQGKVPNFIFSTADGTISGYVSSISSTQSQIAVDNSASGAVYFGLAISATSTNANPLLYAPNFNSGNIDVFDTNYKPATLAGNFADPAVPSGYGPWNIWNLGGKLYVMYAKQNAAKNFAVAGVGNGYVAIFDLNGNLIKHLASNGPLNAPWGVAIAPATFGAFANDILVGNFADGLINAFDPNTGAAMGALQDQNGNTLAYPGLWGLLQGNGGSGGDANAIYFVTGYANQKHGLLGSIQAAPTINSVSNAADIQTGIAPNSYISIYGANLSPVTRNWDLGDFSGNNLPRFLSGVSVTVNGKAAYVYYVNPKQIDVLTPVDTATGSVNVVVTNNGLVSNTASVTTGAFSPAFFLFKDGKSIAAIHPGGGVVGATTLYAGISTPAHANETIALFGTGFGTTTPNFTDGQVVPAPLACTTTPTVSFGSAPAQVAYCGLVGSGLYQVNVVVPAGASTGDNVVTITFSGTTSNSNAMINVQ